MAAREDAARLEAKALEARTLDRVRAGVAEDEAAHALEQTRSDSGWFAGRPYRAARADGRFGYTLRPAPSRRTAGEAPAALRVTYWGGETRRHRFEVLVDGEPVATQSLFDDAPGEPFAVEYALPARAARSALRVSFRPLPGSSVGAVFEVRLVLSPARAAARSSRGTRERG